MNLRPAVVVATWLLAGLAVAAEAPKPQPLPEPADKCPKGYVWHQKKQQCVPFVSRLHLAPLPQAPRA